MRLVFNGEIYNFRELRAEPEQRGHPFRTHVRHRGHRRSSTRTRGVDFVEALDGMFALAIWDERAGRLLLARDRVGKKPLFYALDDAPVVFGSEIKALFAHPEVPMTVDETAVPAFFQLGYAPHPATIYGASGRWSRPAWWRSRWMGRRPTRPTGAWRSGRRRRGADCRAEARERVRALVVDAVRKRLVSDVPLGAFLSAGIDSTVVVGVIVAADDQAGEDVHHRVRRRPRFRRDRAGAGGGRAVHTEHTTFRVTPSAVGLIDRLIWHHDGPFGDSSAIPTFLLAELTRRHVTVALTGDGGDELFAGYLRFRAALAAERLPPGAGAALAAALRVLPRPPSERHLLARARRFARFAHVPLVERAARWNSLFPDGLAELLQPDMAARAAAADPLTCITTELEASAGASPLGRLLAANFASYLPDDLLVKTDRCTMAHSLEAQSPLLDTALAEYAASLPDSFKLTRTRTKAIFREAFADLIPRDIDRRPKTGFGVPLDRWFRTELRDFVRDLLLPRSAALAAYLVQAPCSASSTITCRGAVNAGQRLWALVCFERWLRVMPEWRARQLSPQ